MADASQNKPMKELVYALIGTVLFLAMIALIAVSSWLRPAGEHIVADNAVQMPKETQDQQAAQALGDVTSMEETTANAEEDASAEQAQVADAEQQEANDTPVEAEEVSANSQDSSPSEGESTEATATQTETDTTKSEVAQTDNNSATAEAQ